MPIDLSEIFFEKLCNMIDFDIVDFVNKYIVGFGCPVDDLPLCKRYQNYECKNCYLNIKTKHCPIHHKIMYYLLLFLRNSTHFVFSVFEATDIQESSVFARNMFKNLIELLRIIKIIKKV